MADSFVREIHLYGRFICTGDSFVLEMLLSNPTSYDEPRFSRTELVKRAWLVSRVRQVDV
jgi:hypothetical protein